MAIEIDSIEKLIAFSKGEYGRGTSSEYLDVVLTKDLDFADYEEKYYNWSGCTGTWYINFDGREHKVDNIYYMGSETWGFFGAAYSSTIKNLKLTNLYVTTTGTLAAGISPAIRSSTIKNCHVSGQIESLTGEACAIAANQLGTSYIRECSFSGTVKGSISASGITFASGGMEYVLNCAVRGNVITTSANQYGVGFWGHWYATIISCSFIGTAQSPYGVKWTQNDNANNSATTYNSYIVMKEGSSNVTGGRIYNCYYDENTAAAAGITCTGTAASTEQLQNAEWLRSKGLPT